MLYLFVPTNMVIASLQTNGYFDWGIFKKDRYVSDSNIEVKYLVAL